MFWALVWTIVVVMPITIILVALLQYCYHYRDRLFYIIKESIWITRSFLKNSI